MIRYQDDLDGIATEDLSGFFANWPNPPDLQTHRRILEGSDEIVIAIDDETQAVAGFITAITDGVLAAYIPLLEVRPACQGRGIGRELTRRMIAKLTGFYMIDLLCDRNLEEFYEPLGMRAGFGMMIRNYDCQSGRRHTGPPAA